MPRVGLEPTIQVFEAGEGSSLLGLRGQCDRHINPLRHGNTTCNSYFNINKYTRISTEQCICFLFSVLLSE
jgi:hypothetical protein